MKKLFLLFVAICITASIFESCEEETSFMGGTTQTSAKGSGTYSGTVYTQTYPTYSYPATTYTADNTCYSCGGSGYSSYTCTWCDGDGIDPAYEHTKGSVMHTFAEKDCASCGGRGLKKCGVCYGSGRH